MTDMAGQLVVLEGVGWDTYDQLLAEIDHSPGMRFSYDDYDDGTLQIRVGSFLHERANRLLASIVEMVTMEWELDIALSGSITIKRPDLHKGFEPDSSFYIRNAAAVRGKYEFDFTVDPPPDLVIEVDINSDSMNKFPIFAAVGVREVWRYHDGVVSIHVARQGGYIEAAKSEMLPPLTGELLTSFLKAGLEQDRPLWIRGIREWARSATRS